MISIVLLCCETNESIEKKIIGSWGICNPTHDIVTIFYKDSVIYYLDGRKLSSGFYEFNSENTLIIFKRDRTSTDTNNIWKLNNVDDQSMSIVSLYDMSKEVWKKNLNKNSIKSCI